MYSIGNSPPENQKVSDQLGRWDAGGNDATPETPENPRPLYGIAAVTMRPAG
jgi:hypothetical protein